MDESWRMRMGYNYNMQNTKLPNYPPRRSTDKPNITPEDFSDVFGGPPKTVLSRQFSCSNLPRSSSTSAFSYEDLFRTPAKKAPGIIRKGRSLPQFSIPVEKGTKSFYSDIFGWDDHERVIMMRSRSKTSSSSVLSSEEVSPLRPMVSDGGEDVNLFASKLRPINVRSKWNPAPTERREDHQRKQNTTPFTSHNQTENDYLQNINNYTFEPCRKTTSPDHPTNPKLVPTNSFRFSADDLHLNSPSSAVSSVSDTQIPHEIDFEILRPDEQDDHIDQEDEEDEIMSAYVIEINTDDNTCESNGVDEAIAWAKEKFQSTKCSEEEKSEDDLSVVNVNQIVEDSLKSTIQTEMDVLDEQIRLWSAGKESDIRLLLASLHNILWHNSGWSAVSMMNMIESSQVKKAYQKARLCLHPDKLQQRGATITQKYIAENVFSILQDAWAGFISNDVF